MGLRTLLKRSIKHIAKVNKLIIHFSVSISLSSCVMHSVGDLEVKFVNRSPYKYFVDESEGCDSCNISRDVRYYCSNTYSSHVFPKVVMPGESVILETKLRTNLTVFAINADSLDKYCSDVDGRVRFRKQWVQIFHNKVDEINKTCTIFIN